MTKATLSPLEALGSATTTWTVPPATAPISTRITVASSEVTVIVGVPTETSSRNRVNVRNFVGDAQTADDRDIAPPIANHADALNNTRRSTARMAYTPHSGGGTHSRILRG